MTEVVVQHLMTKEMVKIKCRDLVKKIAVYKDRLAVSIIMISLCVYIVCMYVRMRACVCVCMYVYVLACVYVCTYTCLRVCMYVRMRACASVCVCSPIL